MTILYLHGLESKLSDVKRAVLEEFATVIAPDMDYKSNSEMFNYLLETYKNDSIDCIIGSSMGGFMGYHIAMTLGCPALLFNPALPIRSLNQVVPQNVVPKQKQRFSIVLGSQDETVPAISNLKYFSENLLPTVHFDIKIRPDLAHQIPLEIFEEECNAFLRSL
ncbi:YqiA/YcfP family alpha/beta fold hydrolase [Flavobacterium sp. SM2513]|uniref:YqiA/YcfP family alpha/beta fold hydrolase n=1 Tax=Flavobacterium sp. SM2513 TaxID=3424766 RepID=UPI003D7FA5DC